MVLTPRIRNFHHDPLTVGDRKGMGVGDIIGHRNRTLGMRANLIDVPESDVIGPLSVTPIQYLALIIALLVAAVKDTVTVLVPSHWIGAVTNAPLLELLPPRATCNWIRFFPLSLSPLAVFVVFFNSAR